MVRELQIKDKILIKKAFKRVEEFDSIEGVYFLLADGSVIIVSSCYRKTPSYQWIPNLETKIARFGGFCPNDDGGILTGEETSNDGWRFCCNECDYEETVSDRRVDEKVHTAMCAIERDNFFSG